MRRQVEHVRTSYEFPDASRELDALSVIDFHVCSTLKAALLAVGLGGPDDPLKTLLAE
jgi:hypothetical protein